METGNRYARSGSVANRELQTWLCWFRCCLQRVTGEQQLPRASNSLQELWWACFSQFWISAGQWTVSAIVQHNSLSMDPDLHLKAHLIQVRSFKTLFYSNKKKGMSLAVKGCWGMYGGTVSIRTWCCRMDLLPGVLRSGLRIVESSMTSCWELGVGLFLLCDGSNILIYPCPWQVWQAAVGRAVPWMPWPLWAEQEGGAASSPSPPARDMIQILQLIDCTDLAARKG